MKLSVVEIQKRILKLDEFEPSVEGVKQLGEPGDIIEIKNLVQAMQNLVAAGKLKKIDEPPEQNCNGLCPKFKVVKTTQTDVFNFFKKMREIENGNNK